MSMRDYACYGTGLIIADEDADVFLSKYASKFNEDEDFTFCDLYERSDLKHQIVYVDETDITLHNLNDDEENFDSAIIIATLKFASLFEAAYSSKEELIEEFKSDLGDLLPEDFDYEKYVGEYSYTEWG